jgi:hypothetical protein
MSAHHLNDTPRGVLPWRSRRYDLPARPYVWRDPRAGRDAQVRAILASIRASGQPEPEPRPKSKPDLPTKRQEHLAIIASLRMSDTSHPGPEEVTLAQAAERLGVSLRTVQRYKADLRAMAGAS